MLRASLVLLVFGALVQGQSISEILYGKKGSLDAHVHYDPDLLDNLLKKNYGQIVDEDWSRYNQLQVFMAFIDASCTLPEGKRAAGAAALAHQGYFAGESDAAAAGLDGLGLRGLARFQKNYQEALARFGADKCGESSIKIIESLVEMINKRREATPNGTPAPNEPPPYRQVLDRESFELLKQALESKGRYPDDAMRKKAYLIDLYRQRCEAQSYFCAILERLKVTLKDIPDMQLPPMPKPPPFNPKTLPPPTKRRVQAPDAPFTLGSELYVSLGEALDLTAISGEQRVRGQIVRFIGNANNGVKSIGKVVTIKVSRPNPNHRPGGGAAILVMESVSLDGKDVPVTTRLVPRSVPGPGSNYFGPGVLRAGTRLVFVVEP